MNHRTLFLLLALSAALGSIGACAKEESDDSGTGGGHQGGKGGTAGKAGAAGTSGHGGKGKDGTGGKGTGGDVGTGGEGGETEQGGNAGEGGEGGQGGKPGGGGSSGTGGTTDCPGTGGPAMVRTPLGFCIDGTEVTREQYEGWLSTSPSKDGQPTPCEANEFSPDSKCMSGNSVCKDACGNQPQVCVDWCDATAFCKAAGKRLCGKIGGGPNGYNDHKTSAKSQWFAACASNGKHAYPYGDDYAPQACNGLDLAKKTTVEVSSLSGCQSAEEGYGGIYDLSGNVWEWEDACDGDSGATDLCRLRGGALNMAEEALRCDKGYNFIRNMAEATIGFRCCT